MQRFLSGGAVSQGLLESPDGLRFHPGFLDRPAQEVLRDAIARVAAEAPLFRPRMPRSGAPMSVLMTNCGPLGWMTDIAGYRYEARHPETGRPWPAIPRPLLEIWDALARYEAPPEACLVNVYDARARMGLHRDFDEADFSAPVISISLGDTALFRVGGPERRSPTRSFRVASGDVVVLAGAARLAFHGIDRVLPATSTLLPEGGRLNLTLRRVTAP